MYETYILTAAQVSKSKLVELVLAVKFYVSKVSASTAFYRQLKAFESSVRLRIHISYSPWAVYQPVHAFFTLNSVIFLQRKENEMKIIQIDYQQYNNIRMPLT